MKPILAMELPRSAEDLRRVVDDSEHDYDLLSQAQRLDSEQFIPAYGVFYLLVVWLARRRGSGLGACLATLAAIAVLVAVAFDYAENAAIDRVLPPGTITDAGSAAIRQASLVKWTALFVATALLGLQLTTRRYRSEWPRTALAIAGSILLVAAILGLGVWFEPQFATLGTYASAGAIPILLGTVLARPQALDDPIPMPTS